MVWIMSDTAESQNSERSPLHLVTNVDLYTEDPELRADMLSAFIVMGQHYGSGMGFEYSVLQTVLGMSRNGFQESDYVPVRKYLEGEFFGADRDEMHGRAQAALRYLVVNNALVSFSEGD